MLEVGNLTIQVMRVQACVLRDVIQVMRVQVCVLRDVIQVMRVQA